MGILERRSFLKHLVTLTLTTFLGLSQKKAMAQQDQKTTTESTKDRKRIAVEEHITSQDYRAFRTAQRASQEGDATTTIGQSAGKSEALIERVDLRLKAMDDAGIDMQVLSWGNPGVEEFEHSGSMHWMKTINDGLGGLINQYPDRFAAFASIPWQEPDTATKELERAVKELGLKGVKVDGTVNGEYLDSKRFRPIFQKFETLDVPIFIHPEDLTGDRLKPYLPYPGLDGAGWGYASDTSLHAVRLIYSGLFDEFPGLKIILGHMGEGLPYWLWRLDAHGARNSLKKKPSEYIKTNFYVSTSGNFFHPALMCACMAMGPDHVLFGVDYPSESNHEGVTFMETAPISDDEKEKIYHLNAERIFKL